METPQQRTARAGAAPAPGARTVKPWLDGHGRGANVIALFPRDTGYEVIGTDPHRAPEQIVAIVVAEDAPVLGLSVLSGAHLTIAQKVINLSVPEDAVDVRVLVGDIIPDVDIPSLEAMGIRAVSTLGADMGQILENTDRLYAAPNQTLEPTC
ncbi:cobalamin-dependent protein [Streptomyces sp. DSM 41524]|uniref:Cobalamin-dependent protein n=1 Tax=Streptomyces asiaticus subsp. ignotus TaxID=3098222 RepID=A0ABU7QDD3_9ACTN|nr:cobalamin-dependent protein [Streptomyces sp. DSM 41524]